MIISPQLSVEKMINNALNDSKVQQVSSFEYVVEEFSIWASKSEVAKSVFNVEGIPQRLKLCFFDIPYITDQSPASDDFFQTLSTEDIDKSLLELDIMQIIIERAWQESYRIYFFWLALPYLTLLPMFFTWSNFITAGEPSEWKDKTAYILSICIMVNCGYIFCQELY